MKIIVIGASGTIGVEVAKALAAKKHEVIAASRKGEVKVDLEDKASIEKLFGHVKDVDAVVSVAGEAAFKPFMDLTDEDYAFCVRSKLMGQVNLARIAAKHIKEKGSVTLTSGVLATKPMAGGTAISMINSGLDGFIRGAGFEAPRGIRFNVVSPPWIKETMVKFGMDPGPGLSSADCAKTYVAAVEGHDQGKIIHAT